MIKERVILRSQVYDVYSSEMQERMKVYFDLSKQNQECLERCTMANNQECKQDCEKVFDQYAQLLKQRYQEDRQPLIDAQVQGLPSYDKYKRKDRGWFYAMFDRNLSEYLGTPDKNSYS